MTKGSYNQDPELIDLPTAEDDSIEVQQGMGEPGQPGPAAVLHPKPSDDAGDPESLDEPGDFETGQGGAAPAEADPDTDLPEDCGPFEQQVGPGR